MKETLKVINKNFTNAFVVYIKPRDYLWEKNLDESSYNEIQGYRIALLQYDALQQCFNFAKKVLLQEKYNYTWYRSRGDLLINKELNYKIIFNGSPKKFLQIMNEKNFDIDIDNEIWKIK